MCLIMTVRLSERDAGRARDIAASTNSPDSIEVAAAHRLFRRATRDLNICEHGQGCACSMLHDDADWDAPAWRMRPEVLPRLASTLAKIREHSSEPFTFQARWVGDEVTTSNTCLLLSCVILSSQIRLALTHATPSHDTNASNHAMQRAAGRSAFQLSMTFTFNLQRRGALASGR